MSLHYKQGQSDDFEFVRPIPDADGSRRPSPLSEAHDDPDELEDMDAPEDDDDRAGVL